MGSDRVAIILIRLLGVFFRMIPLRWGLAIARGIGSILFWVEPKRKFIAFANLTQAFAGSAGIEERIRIVRGVYLNLVQGVVEFLRFPKLTVTQIRELVQIQGLEKAQQALAQGRGLIALTAHFGNWELTRMALAFYGIPPVVMARDQKMKQVNEWLNQYRELGNCRVISKGMNVRAVYRFLKENQMVAMLIDQDGGKKGIFAYFLGRLSSTKPGAFLFAQKTGAPLIPIFILRDSQHPHKHAVFVEDPLSYPSSKEDIPRVVSEYLAILERYIQRAPDQWLWLHSRWKSTPLRKIVILSDGKKGHLKQSLAVAELTTQALKEEGKSTPGIGIQTIDINFKNRRRGFMSSLLLALLGNSLTWRWRVLKWGLREESYRCLERERADVIISAGSSLSALNAWLGKVWHARNIHLMRPNLIPWRRFKKIILPAHDWKERRPLPENVILTQMTPSLTQGQGSGVKGQENETSERWQVSRGKSKDGGQGSIGLLLGGDNDQYQMTPEWTSQLLEEILKGIANTDKRLLVTTSRRTPPEVEKQIEEKLKNHPQCDLLEIANRSQQNGVVEKILESSDMVLVTGESISMISESVASGKPVVVVFPHSKTQRETKHQRMVEALEKQGVVKKVPVDQIGGIITSASWEVGREGAFLCQEREKLLEGLRNL